MQPISDVTIPAGPVGEGARTYHYLAGIVFTHRMGTSFNNTEVTRSVPVTTVADVRELEKHLKSTDASILKLTILGLTLLRVE